MAAKELSLETDYINEANNQMWFRKHIDKGHYYYHVFFSTFLFILEWTDGIFFFWEHSERNFIFLDVFYVPEVILDLTTKRVLTSEMVYGEPVDQLVRAPSELRNWVNFLLNKTFFWFEFDNKQSNTNLLSIIERNNRMDLSQVASNILKLCFREIFEWKFMQTDPNWSNFFYDSQTKKVMNDTILSILSLDWIWE